MTEQQAGWYADPSGDATKLRYWDGTQWTNDYAAAQPQAQPQPATGVSYGASATEQFGEQQALSQPAYVQAQPVQSSSDQTLRLAAFILCIISLVGCCWLIIPLAWMIPMSVRCWGIYKGTKPNTTAFGVCTLIFFSLVGGILLLVSKKDA